MAVDRVLDKKLGCFYGLAIGDALGACCEFKRRDYGVPSVVTMNAIIARIDNEIRAGRPVYLHCRGGLGRTGTVVCCWLMAHYFATVDTVQVKLLELRFNDVCPSPDTGFQRSFVQAFGRGVSKE